MDEGARKGAAVADFGLELGNKVELGFGLVFLAEEFVDLLLGHGPGGFVLIAGGGLGLVLLVEAEVLEVGFQLLEPCF